MTIPSMPDFSFKHVDLSDRPSDSGSTRKQQFDSRGVELREFINALVGKLNSTIDGNSGADNIGMTVIDETGNAATIQSVIENLLTRIKATANGESGADLIGATGIPGLSGATVQVLLKSLKQYLDSNVDSAKGAPASIDGVDNKTGNIDLVPGTGISIVPNNDNKTIKITATGEAIPGPHAAEHGMYGLDPISPALIGAAGQGQVTAISNNVNRLNLNCDNLQFNFIDLALEVEILKDAILTGVTANIFIETFQNLDDINLTHGVYDAANKRILL